MKITAPFAALLFGDMDKEIIESKVCGPDLRSSAIGRRSYMGDSGVTAIRGEAEMGGG